MRTVSARTEVVDHFPVYGDDGFTKVPDLGPDAFALVVFHDGEVAEVQVDIAQIPGSPGEYRLAFTPQQAGFYEVEVAYAAGKQVYAEQYQVTEAVVVGGSRPPGWGA